MSETKHTPGPWMAAPTAGYETHGQAAVHQEDGGKNIAIVYDGDADARLIAAAPELLEALESFLRCPSVGSDGPGSTTLRAMDFNLRAAWAAVAKATGCENYGPQ